MPPKTTKTNKPSQDILQINEVRDGIIVMSDGTMRATLIASSLNFALKSEDEQNAIIYAFQSFLNALDYPVQISVLSRKLDITSYLEDLNERKERQANELLRLQMTEYINFVSELIKGSNIMTKTFFITVPFSAQQNKRVSFFDRLTKGMQQSFKANKTVLTDTEFEHYHKQLLQRVEQVSVGLRNIGLRLAPLQTQEVLELYYNMMNPTTSLNQRLHNIAKISAEETEPKNLASQQVYRNPWVE